MNSNVTEGASPAGCSWGRFLALAPGLFFGVSTVTMRVTLGFVSNLRLAIGFSVVAFLLTAKLAEIWPSRSALASLLWRTGFPLIILALLGLFLWIRVADRSLLWPHTVGVDQAHHGALVAYLLDEQHLPEPDPRLAGLSGYPIGAHLIAGALATVFGLNPIQAIWLLAMTTVPIVGMLIVWCVKQARSGRQNAGWAGAFVALTVWIVGWKSGIYVVSHSFFLSQAVSIAVSMTGVALLLRSPEPSVRMAALVSALAVAAFWIYPQGAVVLPACVALTWARPVLTRLKTLGWRVVPAIAGAAIVAGGLGWSRVANSAYFTKEAIGGVGEGVVTQINLDLVGGPWCAALLVLGVLSLTWRPFANVRNLTILGALLGPAAIAGGLLVLRWSGMAITDYRITKNIFTGFPYLVVAVGFLVDNVVNDSSAGRTFNVARSRIPAVAAAGLLLVVASRPQMLRSTSVELVDRDAYALAQQVRKTVNPNDVGIAADMLGSYTIWWAGLRRDASYEWTDLIPRMTRFDDWPGGTRPERFLLVDKTTVDKYVNRPGVVVVRRYKTAALLRRK